MALLINDFCTYCAACETVCPNQAISAGDVIYQIEAARCTECVGHFDEPQCVSVCPAEAIVPDPDHAESKDELAAKAAALAAA